MAQQYRGRIRHWVIWNEPDVWDMTHPGSTWLGSEEDYARLLKTAYLAIKDVDPAQQVLMAGLTYFWDRPMAGGSYLDRLLDVIPADPEAPAHGYYFDGDRLSPLLQAEPDAPACIAEAQAALREARDHGQRAVDQRDQRPAVG